MTAYTKRGLLFTSNINLYVYNSFIQGVNKSAIYDTDMCNLLGNSNHSMVDDPK